MHEQRPRIVSIGLASWDRLIVVDTYPQLGHFAIVEQTTEQPGGTTANSAVALSRLGARSSLVALVGDDTPGTAIRAALERESVDLRWLRNRANEPSDAATVIVSRRPPERTVLWHQGARLRRGDQLDIWEIFAADLVLVDVDDLALRRYLVDLPAHTVPAARLLGAMTYLADVATRETLEIAVAHDALVGNERELRALTGGRTLDDACRRLQSEMRFANLRACAVSKGANGATILTETARWEIPAFPVTVIDTTGAGDAFAAGIAYGMAKRWDWATTGRFANAVAGLAVESLGAQASLPSLDQVASLLEVNRATLE
jgi:sugar/nucleoside kinase (ribokinase family)